MKFTNQQIEDAVLALEQFNPAVHLRAKMRLSQNLKALDSARKTKEHHRIRLAHSVVKDKSRKVEGNGVPLTVEEAAQLQDEYRELMAIEVEVEIRPVEIYDSMEGTQPKDPQLAIDAAAIPIDNRMLSALQGILVEVANGRAD